MDIDIEQIKAAAMAATRGEWHTRKLGVVTGGPVQHFTNGSAQQQIMMAFGCDWMEDGEQYANADYVVVARPDVVLDLLARLERAEADLERQKKVTTAASGFRIQHVDGVRWRTLDSYGMPDWTTNESDALCFSLRKHADSFSADDPEDVRIVHTDFYRSSLLCQEYDRLQPAFDYIQEHLEQFNALPGQRKTSIIGEWFPKLAAQAMLPITTDKNAR